MNSIEVWEDCACRWQSECSGDGILMCTGGDECPCRCLLARDGRTCLSECPCAGCLRSRRGPKASAPRWAIRKRAGAEAGTCRGQTE